MQNGQMPKTSARFFRGGDGESRTRVQKSWLQTSTSVGGFSISFGLR